MQQRIGRLERESTLIRGWQPEVVIGTVQTPAWTAAAFGDPGLAWLEARADRLALLAEIGRTWHLLMAESMLRWDIGRAVMVDQIEHLIEMSRRPNMQIGIVPMGGEKPIPMPSAFHIFGRQTAVVGTPSGTAFITAPTEIAEYEATFEQLDALAVYDDDARAVLARIAAEYRGQSAT